METGAMWIAVLLGIAALFAAGLAIASPRARKILITLCAVLGAFAVVVALVVTFFGAPTAAHRRSSALPPAAVSSPTPQPLTATQINQLNVVGEDATLRPEYAVSETVLGSCDGNSEGDLGDPNAYRCDFNDATGDYVADPCFAFDNGKSVYCIDSPWDLSGTVINLEQPVAYDGSFHESNLDPSASSFPWALEVVDPHNASIRWRCLVREGAGDTIEGHITSFSCRTPGRADYAWILDDIKMDGPVWRVLFDDETGADLTQAEVAAVWN